MDAKNKMRMLYIILLQAIGLLSKQTASQSQLFIHKNGWKRSLAVLPAKSSVILI
jgi:hypothetical protein